MSAFDELKHVKLPNWARWGRQDKDKPNDQQLSASICTQFLRKPGEGDPGWGDEDAIPEAPIPPIDYRAAEDLDGYIFQLPDGHRRTVLLYYYRRKPQDVLAIDAAVRCLLDMLETNRAVNAMMRVLAR